MPSNFIHIVLQRAETCTTTHILPLFPPHNFYYHDRPTKMKRWGGC